MKPKNRVDMFGDTEDKIFIEYSQPDTDAVPRYSFESIPGDLSAFLPEYEGGESEETPYDAQVEALVNILEPPEEEVPDADAAIVRRPIEGDYSGLISDFAGKADLDSQGVYSFQGVDYEILVMGEDEKIRQFRVYGEHPELELGEEI